MSFSAVQSAPAEKRREGEQRPRLCYTTAELAAMRGVLPESVRTSVWRTGEFLGIKPIKSGTARTARLLWPVDQVDAFFRGGAA